MDVPYEEPSLKVNQSGHPVENGVVGDALAPGRVHDVYVYYVACYWG